MNIRIWVAAALLTTALCAQDDPSIDLDRELFIKDLSVVEDPLRTQTHPDSVDPSAGAWTLGQLIENMAGRHNADAFAHQLFRGFEVDQFINQQFIPKRPGFVDVVLKPWRNLSAAKDQLPIVVAPFRLNAIVNRMDLRSAGFGEEPIHAGEGRLIYTGMAIQNQGDPIPVQFTIIFEFELVANSVQEIKEWAELWHALGTLPFGKDYNAALEQVVERFAGKNVAPGKPNGSALNQIRTNDSVEDEPWEWREFRINARTGLPEQVPVAMTPSTGLNEKKIIADFINQFESEILDENYEVPLLYKGVPFRGGNSTDIAGHFSAQGIRNNEARHIFSLNTCVGCHVNETDNSNIFHSFPRPAGVETALSQFMTGVDVIDPVDGTVRHFNELERRAEELQFVLDSTPPTLRKVPASRTVH